MKTFIEFATPYNIIKHELIGADTYTGLTLMEWIANVNTALEVIQADVEFNPAYPSTVLMHDPEKAAQFKPMITWDLRHLSPQQLGGKSGPEPAGGTREARPRLRTITKESDGSEYALYGQMLQAFIQFDVWALTSREAEDLAYWFQQDFMAHYGQVLGSQEVRFYERLRDRDLLKINNKLQTRSLVYYVLLEEYSVKPVDLITRIRARIQKGE